MRDRQQIGVFLIGALVIAYIVWTMTGVVIASRTLKTAHIFPQTIEGVGWSEPQNVRAQQLSGSAPFESFTQTNSAYIIQGTLPRVVPDPEVVTPPPVSEESEEPAPPPSPPPQEEGEEENPEDGMGTTTESGAVPPNENAASSTPPENDAPTTIDVPEASAPESTPEPTPEVAPEVTSSPESQGETQPEATPVPQPEPQTPPTEEQQTASTTEGALGVHPLFAYLFTTASAQEVTSSTTPLENEAEPLTGQVETSTPPTTAGARDVAICVVLEKPCYTLELSGFGVDGSLKEKRLQRVELNFSFANRIADTSVDDRLTVKYFHNGQWRTGGEVFVNKEFSNATNGGYFTQVLEDIQAWDDLADVKVVVEYERKSDVAVEAYLDSVWLTAVYRDPVQEVVQGGGVAGEPTDVPDNIDFSLQNEGGADPTKLVLPDGMHLFFLYVDDLDEDELVMRADKQEYTNSILTKDGDGPNAVYMSVTNTGSASDEFSLQAAFKGGGAVRELQQFVRNIPAVVVDEPVSSSEGGGATVSVTGTSHTCPTRWQRGDQAYRCSATSEEFICDGLTGGGTICFVESEDSATTTPSTPVETTRTEESQYYTSGWVPVNMPRTEDPTEYPAPGSYVVENISDTLVIHAGQTLYFRAVIDTVDDPQKFIFIAAGDSYEGDLDSTKLRDEMTWVQEGVAPVAGEKKPTTVRISSRDNFDGDELPEFKFKFKTQRGIITRLFNSLIGRDNTFNVAQARLIDSSGEEKGVPVNIEYGEDGEWTLEVKQQPRGFRPGKFQLEISVDEDGNTYTDTVEFYWGVLAVNTNKSIYEPGENVRLMMAALTDSGDTICDANLELVVTDPNGEEYVVNVRQSGACGDNNVTDIADYLADYRAGPTGTYDVLLASIGPDSTVLHQIRDSFEVQETPPFVIERSGATRIWPVANYVMELTLTAVNDFKGEFIEAMPEDFVIVDAGGGESEIWGGAKRLTWKVDMVAGETQTFRYEYDSPDISPYLYLLGPAEVRAGDGLPFTESRQWKIASDAVGNMLLYWDQTWIPTGWTCVSCLASDAFYQRFVMGSSTAGTNGGAATHTHTATGNVPATGSGGDSDSAGGGADVALNTHTHTYNPIIDFPSNLPPYRHLAVIQYNSTGNPTQIPAGAIAMFDVASSSLPSGWYRLSAQDGRFVRAESTSTIGTTGGSATHSHAISGNTLGPTGTTNASGSGVNISSNSHTHTITANTGSVNHEPPYLDTIYARLSATTSPTNDMIAMWSGDPATGWTTVSSSTEVFASRFAKASTTYSTTQYGSATHTHADVTGIVVPASASVANRTTTGSSDAVGGHTHTASVTNFSTVNHLPPYRTAVFAKRAGGDTPPITLHDTPFESEKTGSSTPAIEFTANDPDGSAELIYNVQWDDDADLDVSPIGNASSTNEAGCSPNCFQNLVSTGDTSPFNEAERVRFRIQTPLVSGTTYYYRVRAQESGNSTWGSWSTTTSFTYIANTDPSQWFQTDDAQFETGTLVDTETTGSGGVQINVEDPVEAMIVYGEGAITTPRYRIWDGDSWSVSEGDAQDVGGQIQWVKVKAGTTRREYVLGTQDTGADVNVQVYDVDAGTWGDLQEVIGGGGGVADITNRGFDVAYESNSGDALVVYCDGNADPSYYVWDGSTWTLGTSVINLTSANNCEWIRLASDPTSDEIIMVTRDTGAGYEAQVWDGTQWGNAETLGSMTDVLHEGIAVEYEESGNQAVVVVSNGNGNNFIWSAWDGSQWSAVPVTETLQNDFEWGELTRDVGNDRMTLCYGDQSDDLGFIHWDGDAWESPLLEFEGNGNTGSGGLIDSPVISCKHEVTAGRDHLVMMAYSDTTNSRYQYASSTPSGEASVDVISDAWSVSTVRTGDGNILGVFFDTDSTQYDFSYWNGSTWSGIQTLEGSPSDTTQPYSEPVGMAAEIFVASEGTIMSDSVDFDLVAGQPTWGEVLWNTTEPSGTDVQLQVYYGPSCSSLVPDGDLPGNAASFQATSSPLDLSGLSTTTYNQLCLSARLSSQSQNNPTLDDWTISWERQPYLTQTNFKWYVNAASLTPTDIWPSGTTDLNENDAISTSFAPILNNVLRLRMNILTENVSLSSSALSLRLQYAEGQTCEADMTWLDVGAIGSTTAEWRGYDNAGVSDGATLPSTVLSTSDVSATYEEQNDSSFNPSTATVGQETEWDWVLQHNAPNATYYCFRAINADNTILNAYDRYPALVTNTRPSGPQLEKPFDNEELASTTPWFEFAAEDPEGNDITYQIQIDDNNDFSSTFLDRDSQTNFSEFTNTVTPADKDPFNAGQTIRFVPSSALSNGTTYYWRVRGKDRNASNDWSEWSDTYSVTINTGVSISTWMQTTDEQFDTDTLEDTETSGSDYVEISSGFTFGTTTSSAIDFDDKSTGNAWGELSWTDNETAGDIKYHVEYLDGSTWSLIPDADLSGNNAGYDTSPVSLLGLSPTTYNQIRLRADFTDSGGTPRLSLWRVEWGYAVEQPTLSALFDNEKTGTTTPTFSFLSNDPQNDDLVYQISISTTNDFAASTTRSSDIHSGFSNTASSTDTSPFETGDTIAFKVQQADALTDNTTYWWRVRARDPSGDNVWSTWSELRSFTVDTTVTVSTWFQTTDEQFETDDLNDAEITGSDSARVTSIVREAMVAYGEGTAQVPRYKIWNGSSWGTEGSGVSIGDTIRFVELAASPTRDEYVMATMGSTGVVDAQVYTGGSLDAWGTSTEVVAAANNNLRRGFDIAYETDSGDAIAVACSGTEATYKVWDGSDWSASTPITLGITNNCEWIKLASDPTSDEMIMVVRDTTLGAVDYQALVWDGDFWGNATTSGSQFTAANEGIALEYEESGGQAVMVTSNGQNNNFTWKAWDGSNWSLPQTVAIVNDFAAGRMCRDEGTDDMALIVMDIEADLSYVLWDGSNWGTISAEFETFGNSANGRPISCEYEVTAGRDGYVMMPYSDTTQAEAVYWDGALNGPTILNTITDSWEVRTARTGDGNILAVFYDDATTEYDFSYWNGSQWSAEQVLETNSIANFNPRPIPIDIVARQYPSFTSGTIVSTPIDFDDGLGPRWEQLSWNDTTPGSSDILYQVEYYATSTDSWELIPDSALTYNSTGATTSPRSLAGLSRILYNDIRVVANLNCVGGQCPTLNDWTVKWSEGIVVSGTAQQYDQSTNVTSGTVALAVNGVLQAGKTAAISGGTWSISNVTAFEGDVVTVFIDSAADANEAAAVTVYDGEGDITGIPLYERHLTIGSNDNATVSNANIALYDYTAALNDEDLFFDVDASNDLTVCSIATCNDAELFIKSGNTYRPDSASSGNVSTHDIENNGTITADGNTFYVNGSWDNNSVFTANTSSVIFTATSTTETIDSTGASTAAFNNVTLGQTSGSATWNQSSYFDVNGALTITYGTLAPGSSSTTIAGNFTINTNGIFTKGSATTTFDGSGSSTFTDSTTAKQDLGKVAVDGSTKTLILGAAAKFTDFTIGADDIFDVDNNYAVEILGNWTNHNSFLARSGTVNFTSTATGKTIAPGSSSFYNLTFNGVGGNWSFTQNTVTATNDFSVYNGIPTFPTATTTIGGSLNATSSNFMHNNGAVVFNSSSAKTVRPGSSSFYDLAFNGSGSWSFTDGFATSSRHTIITTGTVTMPSGVFAVGGSFTKDGGTLTHNSGTLKLTATGAQTVKLGGSDVYNMTFSGVGGSWSFSDTNATSTNSVRFDNGTVTLPSGVFAVGGSWTVSSGAFTHNSGTVKFNSSDTGETVNSAGSWFANLLFDSATGGWTVSSHATSTATTTLANANDFTLSSGQTLAAGAFINSVGGASTTWAGSTLSLTAGSYSINTKTTGGDTYELLRVAADTDIRMWNSSASSYDVSATGSLYSQDHAAVDGDLYIWGEYVANDNEYWAYAFDFDGTSLGGSSRQVDVRFASNANMIFASGTLRILGISSATTTLANQGSGTYALTMTAGTLNAQYYSIKNTDVNGFYILGAPTISSLANGDFELGFEGGASLSLAASVINQNPALQIQQVSFATSSGITSGYNVVASTTASSYWWFRNHYGNYDGENFDNDLGGNPGYIRWDDSSLVITVEGRVFSDHGTTAIGNPPCDGSNNVRIVVSGDTVGSFTGSCDGGTGAYSIPGVTLSGDVTLTAYLNTNGGAKAVAVTKTPTTDIAHLDLYQNSVIVRHEDTAAMSIADMAVYDFTDDSDIPFTAATGSPNTLIVQPNTELYVWSQKTFTPGGNMTLDSGGSGSERDGRLYMATSSTFTAGVAESHSIGGGMTARLGSTFSAASNSTFTFAATTTGKSINADVPLAFYNLSFNGSGGGWSLDSTATTTVQNNFVVTQGTLSGTSTVVVSSGDLTGNGTIAMSGGTFVLETSGLFGGTSPWQFRNLTLGSGTIATTTKSGTGTTTVSGIFRVQTSQIFEAGNAPIVLSGGGTPFALSGTFRSQSAPFYYTATTSTNIADTTYAALTFAPADVGTPTYSLLGGTLTASSTRIGDSNPVVVNANTNDPSINVTGNVTIGTGSTFVASNVGAFDVGGSWSNSGTFTHSNGSVRFNSTDTGETVTVGNSTFYDLEFNSSSGGWTLADSATTTRNLNLAAASSFTQAPGTILSVGGTFTNSVGGGATTWTGSTLALVSNTSYTINTKLVGADTYNTLSVASSTDVRMWNSSAGTTSIATDSSLYSQDHAAVDGDLYIWGEYTRSTGSDYWSYETDFDGTSLSGSGRQVDVRIATSSTVTLSGGVLDVIGTTTATTTIANQGAGRYALAVSGGSFNAQYYSIRNTDPNGLTLSGSPTISSLSNGDYELDVDGGTMLTIAGSVITANPLKIIARTSFATTTNAATGTNVRATGSTASSWKFNLHYGNFDGEPYDDDPTGDPGYLRWDDSAAQITIQGNVYSDEGITVSSGCDGATDIVRVLMQGILIDDVPCDAGTGLYTVSNIAYNPGDTITVFLNGTTTQAANISVDPITNISDMHLYEHRVIVRHEDTSPLTIAQMAVHDSDQDADIPFDAEDAATDTLELNANTKLIVWDEKTFAPAGNITINSGAGTAWDGTLELRATSTLSAAGTQSHTVGGSFILGAGATFSPANSTVTFTATTTGKTITPRTSSFYNIVFNGVSGNWAFSGAATSSNDFTITNGTVTLPNATTTVGGSFVNTGGTFMHNNGVLLLTSTSAGESIRVNGSNLYSLIADGTGGSWSFVDTHATTSNNFTIANGSITLPSSILAVGSSFENSGTFTHNSGTVKLTAAASGKNVQSGGSNFYNILFNGAGGEWTFVGNATSTNNFTITNGSTTLPTQLAVGGSFENQGTFAHNFGTVRFNATATGKSVTASSSSFYNVIFNGTGGGWTITGNATSTNDFSLSVATNFTLAQGSVLSVGGTFTNSVGGSATTWATTTLALISGTNYSINTKSAGGDVYGTLSVASSTDIRSWNSSAATTTVSSDSSLYSQDHAAIDGDLYIWGEYTRSSGTDYWSYATDFDGTALAGSSRQVDVRIATSSSVTLSGGTLNIVGVAGGATTTIANQGTGRYAFSVTGGTLNANYYQIRNTDPSGLALSGTPTISSLAYGDFELDVNGGSLITVAGSTIDANASLISTNVRFATSTGIASGYNVTRTGSPVTSWTFSSGFGNYYGENFDSDGGDACGYIRWSDSSCLFVSQEHYRWRNDDGGEGVPDDEWYNASWSKRKRLNITNNTGGTLANIPVKVVVDYDGDMQSDFDDLRFTDSSGTTSISHWTEDVVTSASSTVWVEVPSLPASGSAVVYMYYGNNSVSTGSDGSATFTFFDDFEDDNISEYSGNTSMFDVDTTYANTGTYGLDAGVDVDEQTTTGLYRTGSLTAQGQTIRFFQYVDADFDDEPCTLFGVGGVSDNYAVCLDQFPSDAVVLSEDVESNDGSGSTLDSEAVTFTDGWYEVEIDWLSGGTINVTVYDSTGATFATLSASDSSNTSGGVGFSYWAQHGGWDTYMSRPYAATDPSYMFGAEQGSGGATWKFAEDTRATAQHPNENIRLRFSIQNTGAELYSQLFRLQVASKGTSLNCESVPQVNYNDVPTTTGGCGSSPACMVTSSQFTNEAAATPLLSYPGTFSYASGQILEDPSNQTASSSVPNSAATEVEYNFQMTNNASANAYCFRTTNGGLALDNYTKVAEVAMSHPPQISNLTLNNTTSIVLTEGATTTVYASSTVTDNNGYTDLVTATSTIYRSGVGADCTDDENNCYQLGTGSCEFTGCSGSTCSLQCRADLQYIADPTDVGSSFAAENWLTRVHVVDSAGEYDLDTLISGVELLTLYGLSVDSNINYGSIEVGQNTGAVNATTTVNNTGNSGIDILLSGTDLESDQTSIAVNQQKFSTTTFAYGSCSICDLLTGSATNVEVDLPKPTATTTPSTDDLYWGLNVPSGTAAILHQGTNTFIATSD